MDIQELRGNYLKVNAENVTVMVIQQHVMKEHLNVMYVYIYIVTLLQNSSVLTNHFEELYAYMSVLFLYLPVKSCQHNTIGEHCSTCLPGYYGNPLLSTPYDCKKCKCPLEVISNNFSPTCTQATKDYDKYSIAPEEYICDSCPRGYAGAHCER